jgi:hypothetical protein
VKNKSGCHTARRPSGRAARHGAKRSASHAPVLRSAPVRSRGTRDGPWPVAGWPVVHHGHGPAARRLARGLRLARLRSGAVIAPSGVRFAADERPGRAAPRLPSRRPSAALAVAATDNGLLAPELAAGMGRVRSAKSQAEKDLGYPPASQRRKRAARSYCPAASCSGGCWRGDRAVRRRSLADAGGALGPNKHVRERRRLGYSGTVEYW